MEDVIIIGAGIGGLSTAYHLKKKNISFKILEGQNRLGGRIETIYGNLNTPMEMGATWFNKDHKNLIQLLTELKIGYFEQQNEGIALFETISFEPPQQYFVPANTHSAYRVQGGTYHIIEKLHQNIGKENVVLNTEIVEIIDESESVKIIDSSGNTFRCKLLIMALPPKLLIDAILFSPSLPPTLYQIMRQTQTWMSGAAKFSVEYKKPFWKKDGFSGSVYSQSGLATEIYDHSNFEETKFALKGFLNSSANHYSFKMRKEKVIEQLKHYFGNEAQDFESYNDKIWNDKYIQPNNDVFLPPHFNNGHSLFRESYMNNKLFFTGTEVSPQFSGYMEGAIIASIATHTSILRIIKK
nr:NAD(P)/FAD-dependent oxidoreductase [uncultured Emticicia sp.]